MDNHDERNTVYKLNLRAKESEAGERYKLAYRYSETIQQFFNL